MVFIFPYGTYSVLHSGIWLSAMRRSKATMVNAAAGATY
jgi:hypothetical protein